MKYLCLAFALVLMSGCFAPPKGYDIIHEKGKESGLNAVVAAFTEAGYTIKHSDTELGLVTTEMKHGGMTNLNHQLSARVTEEKIFLQKICESGNCDLLADSLDEKIVTALQGLVGGRLVEVRIK